MSERHADRVVPPGRTVDQEPAALRAPGAGRQLLRSLKGRGLRPDVDPLDAGRHVVQDGRLAERGGQVGIGAGPFVAWNVEAPRIAGHVGHQRVQIRSFPLLGHQAPCGGSPPAYWEYGYHHSFGATSLSM